MSSTQSPKPAPLRVRAPNEDTRVGKWRSKRLGVKGQGNGGTRDNNALSRPHAKAVLAAHLEVCVGSRPAEHLERWLDLLSAHDMVGHLEEAALAITIKPVAEFPRL
jgi:hypothetical protein